MLPRHLSAGLHQRLGRLTRDLKQIDTRDPRTIRAAIAVTDDLIRKLTELREWLNDKLDDEPHQPRDRSD